MNRLGVDESRTWLAAARAAVSQPDEPAMIEGPFGIPAWVKHSGQGHAVIDQLLLEVELAPGVLVDLADVRIAYDKPSARGKDES